MTSAQLICSRTPITGSFDSSSLSLPALLSFFGTYTGRLQPSILILLAQRVLFSFFFRSSVLLNKPSCSSLHARSSQPFTFPAPTPLRRLRNKYLFRFSPVLASFIFLLHIILRVPAHMQSGTSSSRSTRSPSAQHFHSGSSGSADTAMTSQSSAPRSSSGSTRSQSSRSAVVSLPLSHRLKNLKSVRLTGG